MGNPIGDLVSLTLYILGVILTVIWIFFPFLILSKMNKILKELQKLNGDETLRRYQTIKPTGQPPEA